MPALKHPAEISSVELPARRAQVAGEADVLVVGGGPAGLGAALGAAAAGAQVILAERYSFFGGNATAALVMPLMSFHTQHPPAEFSAGVETLLPPDHGPGDPIVAGIVVKLLDRLIKAGGALAPSLQTGYVVPFDPELFKLVALELLDEAGVQFLLHAFASAVIGDGRSRARCSKPSRAPWSSARAPLSIVPAMATWRRTRVRRSRSAERTTGWCSR